ncbi:MAG: class I SAM-dependent methyltransferase [Gammaproteobacteria bacterium]
MNYTRLFKKLVKRGIDELQHVFVAVARCFGVIDYPVPPNSSMRKTSSRSIRHYYISGIQTALPIATTAIRERVALHEKINILDFGCGVGRQLLHFTRHYPNPNYYACDIDDTSIEFVCKEYPQVNAYASRFHPPLKYENNFFDSVYSVSIFSHLSIEDHRPWLNELARITKPGGYCFLTIEGRTALDALASDFNTDTNKLEQDLKKQGYLYKEYDFLKTSVQNQNVLRGASFLVGVEGSYGNMAMSLEHIKKEWDTEQFQVIDIIEGIIDYRQDLVILKRK